MKIVTSVFVISLGYPKENAKKMIEIMDQNEGDIYLFPAYCLTGSSAGELYDFPEFKQQTEDALDKLCEYGSFSAARYAVKKSCSSLFRRYH